EDCELLEDGTLSKIDIIPHKPNGIKINQRGGINKHKKTEQIKIIQPQLPPVLLVCSLLIGLFFPFGLVVK
ncbi:MAG: hypothetical protein ACKPH7_08575, partial [Planktothrix sp.]|uniref:hypothetical protein n=1 Tax=Planktothrix sp. TaxID=3088171 RepID=UPI0038D37E25